jgi:hypothetical protein
VASAAAGPRLVTGCVRGGSTGQCGGNVLLTVACHCDTCWFSHNSLSCCPLCEVVCGPPPPWGPDRVKGSHPSYSSSSSSSRWAQGL